MSEYHHTHNDKYSGLTDSSTDSSNKSSNSHKHHSKSNKNKNKNKCCKGLQGPQGPVRLVRLD